MIPIGDTIRSERWPIVNYALIGLCTYAMWLEYSMGADANALVSQYGLVPARFLKSFARSGFELSIFTPFLTSMFLHGGFLHFAGNMLFLWVFGDNVEDRMGHAGYALFYLVGGIAATATHLVANPNSLLPTIGASGAIAAVMGAYMLLYPGSRVATLLVVFVFVRRIEVPAFAWLGIWFLFQLMASGVAAGANDQGGVAVFAHLGGFVFGAAVVLLLGLRAPRRASV